MTEQTNNDDFGKLVETFREDYENIIRQVQRVIVGCEQVIHEVMGALLGGGHALLEGVPGLGKTLLVRTLSDVLDLSFSRIQFTPDLMPADIIGTSVVTTDESGNKSFRFHGGPIFANLILADEINRATPKTQSALLEAMQEQTVSVGRTTHELSPPFFVLATQNPLEMEGTYPLPEAQLDRFMLKIDLGRPSLGELVTILDRTTGADVPQADTVASGQKVRQMRHLVRRIPAPSHVKEYVSRVVLATHPDNQDAPELARKYIRYGSSPRGGQAMMMAGKVRALREGRCNVAFSDVREVGMAALRHRLILNFQAQVEEITPAQIIRDILQQIPQTKTV